MSSIRLRKPHHRGTLCRDIVVNVQQLGGNMANFRGANISTMANEKLSEDINQFTKI